MWTWGDGDFGKAWCANLTDNGDRYIELMTGVYSDNQPDFTYIQPGETKEFTQIWYPVQGIGEMVNATRDGALSLKRDGGSVRFGAAATDAFPRARILLKLGGKTLFEKTVDIAPDQSFLSEITLPAEADFYRLTLALQSEGGKTLVSYTPVRTGKRKKPAPRTVPPRPEKVGSLEELYLHGAHLEQYKHHTYRPEAYYLEALRRDPTDYRCNLAMGRLCSERGDFEDARRHLKKAVRKITMRNDNPPDTESYYLLARAEKLCGNADAAYELYQAAAWQYSWRSQSYFEIARIDCMRGDREKAVRYLKLSLETNSKFFAARTLLGYLLKDRAMLKSVLEESPQDTFARFSLYLLGGEKVSDFILGRPEDVLDAALEFKQAGLYEEAVKVLDECKKPNQLLSFHKAAITGRPAADAAMDYCFPNRLEDIPALSGRKDWRAEYLLGCLYYDRLNDKSGAEAWEKSLALNPENPYALRNLAFAYYDHLNKKKEALPLLQKAFSLDGKNSRMLYELLQLEKNLGFSVEERLTLLESHSGLVWERDDCYLDWVILETQVGHYEKACKLLNARRFHIYEGGEGMLTRHHTWLYTLMGARAMKNGEDEKAEEYFKTALIYPANYGEGRHYSAQEGNALYYTGLWLERQNREAEARSFFEKAAGQPPHLTEITYFAAKSLEKLGKPAEAETLFQDMLRDAEERLRTADLPGYFGVGMSAPLPFEPDIEKTNRIDAYLVTALAEKGLGGVSESAEAVRKLKALDPFHVRLDFFCKLGIL